LNEQNRNYYGLNDPQWGKNKATPVHQIWMMCCVMSIKRSIIFLEKRKVEEVTRVHVIKALSNKVAGIFH